MQTGYKLSECVSPITSAPNRAQLVVVEGLRGDENQWCCTFLIWENPWGEQREQGASDEQWKNPVSLKNQPFECTWVLSVSAEQDLNITLRCCVFCMELVKLDITEMSSSPKYKTSITIYSPLCHSKPTVCKVLTVPVEQKTKHFEEWFNCFVHIMKVCGVQNNIGPHWH